MLSKNGKQTKAKTNPNPGIHSHNTRCIIQTEDKHPSETSTQPALLLWALHFHNIHVAPALSQCSSLTAIQSSKSIYTKQCNPQSSIPEYLISQSATPIWQSVLLIWQSVIPNLRRNVQRWGEEWSEEGELTRLTIPIFIIDSLARGRRPSLLHIITHGNSGQTMATVLGHMSHVVYINVCHME